MHIPTYADKGLLVLALALLWSTFVYILTKYPRDITKSMSQHIGSQLATHRAFVVIGSFTLVVFYYLMIEIFMPALQIAPFFTVILTIGTLLQIIATWIPDDGGSRSKLHKDTAYTAALLYPVLLLGFQSSEIIPLALRVYLILSSFLLFTFMGLLALKVKFVRNHYLPLQLTYIAIWHMGLILTVFVT